MGNKLYLVSPPGRIIMGDLVTLNKTDHQNRPLPENKHNRFFGLAIPKTDPNVGSFLGQIQAHTMQEFASAPHVQQRIQAGLGSGFHWKIEDGDSPNMKNQHAAGCYVVKFSTTLPIRAANNQNVEIDPAQIKRGYWADVSMSVSGNGMTDDTAGNYMNPNTVRLLGYDQEIQSGPSIEQQFGETPAPVVGSQTPVAPAGGMPDQNAGMGGGMPGQGMGGQTGGGMDGVNPHNQILNGPNGT